MSTSCKHCKTNKMLFSTHIGESDCPILLAQYCLYCYERGHVIAVCKKKITFPPVMPDLYRSQINPYKPSLDIRNDDRVINIFLNSKGVIRKGVKDLENYAKQMGLELRKI